MRITKLFIPVLLMAIVLQGCAFLEPGIDDFKASSNIQRVLKVLQASKLIYDTTEATYKALILEIGSKASPTPDEVKLFSKLLSKKTKDKFKEYQTEHDRIKDALALIKQKVDKEGFEFSIKDARAWQVTIIALTQYATGLAQKMEVLK